MIPLFKPFMSETADQEILKTLHSGMIGQGPKVEEFEKALVPWVGRDTLLTVNSCTSAITLALVLAGVQAGDEVITTPMTCAATNTPILNLGAIPVWADINPMTGNIDPLSVMERVTSKTKAVIAVHWGGNPCDLKELEAIGHLFGVPIIEDAAHAFDAQYEGKPIGSHSDFVCFSFQAIKHLTTGDGGLLVCKNRKDYERGKLLRWYGIDRNAPGDKFLHDIPEAGYKFHMNDISATIGLANLAHMPGILDHCQANGKILAAHTHQAIPTRGSSQWLFTVLPEDREAFVAKMAAAGISTSQVHGRNDMYTMFKPYRRNLPGVDQFASRQINVPCGWWLSNEDLLHVAETLAA